MKKQMRLMINIACLNSLKKIKADLKESDYSNICPLHPPNSPWHCHHCLILFPKKHDYDCPCHKGYKKSYLIKRLTQLINGKDPRVILPKA